MTEHIVSRASWYNAFGRLWLATRGANAGYLRSFKYMRRGISVHLIGVNE